jgi:hypothetical protein
MFNTVFAQWDFPLHYKNKRYVPPIKFVENQNNLGNTSVTHGMTLYRKGKCLGANSLMLKKCPGIKQSRVSYAIYNSRTAGQIFMIFILLDLSPPRLAE